ncbi:MAG TPA: DUF6335 family protein [Thermoanaerobaculia bacterium]|nr:DUF6335 family protein [Thermoanaerobaculia bacterium]
MDKTEKLIDWEENERPDRNRNGLDDRIEPPIPDVKAGSAASSSPAPDQGEVDNIGRAMGVTYNDGEELKAGQKERSRDEHRWELDPASSEDYKDRVRDEGGLDRDKEERR